MIDTRLPCRCRDTHGESCPKCREPSPAAYYPWGLDSLDVPNPSLTDCKEIERKT